jgi:hypothetical protein
VKRPQFPDTLHYVFEMMVGINSALILSAGEISSLFIDGLFALDEQGLLFPGVTTPEDRLRLAGMEPMGYERFRRSRPEGDAYTSALAMTLPKNKRHLRDRLEKAETSLGAAISRQRMLCAKLSSVRDSALHTRRSTEENRKSAEALLAAAEAIITGVEAATKTVL